MDSEGALCRSVLEARGKRLQIPICPCRSSPARGREGVGNPLVWGGRASSGSRSRPFSSTECWRVTMRFAILHGLTLVIFGVLLVGMLGWPAPTRAQLGTTTVVTTGTTTTALADTGTLAAG